MWPFVGWASYSANVVAVGTNLVVFLDKTFTIEVVQVTSWTYRLFGSKQQMFHVREIVI